MKTLPLLLLLITNFTLADDKLPEENLRPSAPQGLVYGAGISYQQQIYKGFDQRTIAIPLFGYVGEKFNIFGPFVSYSLLRNDNWNVDLNLSPRFNGYDEEDSGFFIGMQDRKDSLDAGFTLKYNSNTWTYQFKALTDVLSKSKGTDVEFNLAKKFKAKYLTIEPAISINHLNKNLADYYYGVKQGEATLARSFYEASSTINRSFKLSFSHPIPIGLIRLDLNNTWFGSGIYNSPLVDKEQAFGARLFFIGFF